MRRIAFLLAVFSCGHAEAATVNPVSVYSVTTTFGINTHLGQSGYTNLAAVETQLNYIGFLKVRDSVNTVATFNLYKQLYTDIGAKLSPAIQPSGGDSYSSLLSFIQANKNMFFLIEGCNEPNLDPPSCTWNGQSTPAAFGQFQYQLAHDISSLCMPLVTNSDGVFADFSLYSPQPANYLNLHCYQQYNGNTSGGSYGDVVAVTAYQYSMASAKPIVITEFGAWTIPCSTGETQNVQAKYLINYLFDGYILGSPDQIVYELIDEQGDPSCTSQLYHFGVFNNDGSSKVSAITFHNLTTILADSGTSFLPLSLNYSLSGTFSNGHQLLMQKSDGTWWLALWQDTQIWNFITYREIAVSNVSMTLNLGITASTINVYDPYISTAVQQTSSSTNSIVLSVPDHVILVNIKP